MQDRRHCAEGMDLFLVWTAVMYHNPGSSFLLMCKVPDVLTCGLFDRKHKQHQLNGFSMNNL